MLCSQAAECNKHHPFDQATPLNNFGLPLRHNEPTCEFFLRTAMCRFGVRCHKHHPYLHPGPPLDQKPAPAPVGQMPPKRGGPGQPGGFGGGMGGFGAVGQGMQGGGAGGHDGGFNDSQGAPHRKAKRRTDGAEFVIVDDASGYYPEYPSNPASQPCPPFMSTGECRCGACCKCAKLRTADLSRSCSSIRATSCQRGGPACTT